MGSESIPKDISKFHKQMLEYWFDFFQVEPTSAEEILNDKILYNKFLLIQGKPKNEKNNLIKKTKITNLNQHVVENSFETKLQLELEYNCSPSRLELSSLLSAVPSSWKKIIKERSYDIPDLKINILKLTNKNIYAVSTYRKVMPRC